MKRQVESGSPRASADRRAPPFNYVGKYRIDHVIGRGTVGIVYKGYDEQIDRPLAIKTLQPEVLADLSVSENMLERFAVEARSAGRCLHPNIVTVFDYVENKGAPYIIMEYVPAGTLEGVIKSGARLPARQVGEIMAQLLLALDHAHAKGVIHRDIKPTNVLVAQVEGMEVVKLADFAVARVYQTAPFSGLSLTTALVNLASFIPPEVLFNFQEINPLADQYALAAVLYHLLTGAPVLDLPNGERKRFSSLLRRQHVPLRERRGDVPTALADVIHKALSPTPSHRYATIAEFRQAMILAVQGD